MLNNDQKIALRRKLKEWVPSHTFSGGYGTEWLDGRFLHNDPKIVQEKKNVASFFINIGHFLGVYDLLEIPRNPDSELRSKKQLVKKALDDMFTDPPVKPTREWPLCKKHFISLSNALRDIICAGEERTYPKGTESYTYFNGEKTIHPEGSKYIVGNPTDRDWQRLEAAPILLAEAKNLIRQKQKNFNPARVAQLDIILSEIGAFEESFLKMFQEVGIDTKQASERKGRGERH